jgi:hypothetical protein
LRGAVERRIEILMACKDGLCTGLLKQAGHGEERYYNPAKDPKPSGRFDVLGRCVNVASGHKNSLLEGDWDMVYLE